MIEDFYLPNMSFSEGWWSKRGQDMGLQKSCTHLNDCVDFIGLFAILLFVGVLFRFQVGQEGANAALIVH